jgi:hypothetical protein
MTWALACSAHAGGESVKSLVGKPEEKRQLRYSIRSCKLLEKLNNKAFVKNLSAPMS